MLLHREQHVVRQPRCCRPVQFSGSGFRDLNEIRERIGLQRPGRRNPEKVVDHGDDGNEFGWIVRQFVMQQMIEGNHSGEREQEGVIVAGRQERGHRRNAVGTLTVFHHDRLVPAFRQPLRGEARGQVHAAPGRQRHDELDGLLRP